MYFIKVENCIYAFRSRIFSLKRTGGLDNSGMSDLVANVSDPSNIKILTP